jgi:hypothetical protein
MKNAREQIVQRAFLFSIRKFETTLGFKKKTHLAEH